MPKQYLDYPMSGNLGDLKKGCQAPLICWDISSMHFSRLANRSKKRLELQALTDYQAHSQWAIDLQQLLDAPYQALVLTDSSIAIQWVNQGFTQMTGYNKGEVMGRSPKMLQGANTSRRSLKRLRKHLKGKRSFSEELINYRKNGEQYLCQVEIHPLFNSANELCHYLALENEVK
ncbi:MAG: PAS domain-containing protein [Bacteroidota bacterium]